MKHEEYFDNGKVICQHCKKTFNIISPTHLKKEHNTTIEQYKKDFPDAPISSQQFKAKQRFAAAELFKQETLQGKSEDSFFQELVTIPEDNTIPELVLKKLKVEIDENILKKEIKNPQKRGIFIYLKGKYPDLKNNYFIEGKNLEGLLLFRFVTDMADPVNKIDFEFPNTWWHNEERAPRRNRDKILKQDGWTVYNFTSEDIKDIEKVLNIPQQ